MCNGEHAGKDKIKEKAYQNASIHQIHNTLQKTTYIIFTTEQNPAFAIFLRLFNIAIKLVRVVSKGDFPTNVVHSFPSPSFSFYSSVDPSCFEGRSLLLFRGERYPKNPSYWTVEEGFRP